MKRKSIFSLGSVLVATALIGGTFAATAWAITDNANPFGIQVTPAATLPDVSENDTVVLDWGSEARTLANVTGLEMGKEVKAGVVYVRATTGKNTSFKGSLNVTLTTTATGDTRLIDYLQVDVYSGVTEKGELAPSFTVPYTQSTTKYYTKAYDQTVTSAQNHPFVFYVSLASSINPSIYNAVKEQIVTVTVDWGKGSDVQETTSSTVYFKAPSTWENVTGVKIYSWNGSGQESAAFPGTLMTLVDATNKIYASELETGYVNVIFSKSGDQDTKTGDLTYSVSKPYYNGSAWTDAPEIDTSEPDYYLVGDVMGWSSDAKTPMTKGSYEFNDKVYTYKSSQFTFTEGNKGVKVLDSNEVWYGQNGQSDTNNFVMGDAGKYTFYFNPEFGTGAIHAEWEALA